MAATSRDGIRRTRSLAAVEILADLSGMVFCTNLLHLVNEHMKVSDKNPDKMRNGIFKKKKKGEGIK